jgi:hypothetical protein
MQLSRFGRFGGRAASAKTWFSTEQIKKHEYKALIMPRNNDEQTKTITPISLYS